MMYQKNVPAWERWMRIVVGVVLVGYALFGAVSPLLLVVLIASAAVVVVTGMVGFCPACALVGRKLKDKAQS